MHWKSAHMYDAGTIRFTSVNDQSTIDLFINPEDIIFLHDNYLEEAMSIRFRFFDRIGWDKAPLELLKIKDDVVP